MAFLLARDDSRQDSVRCIADTPNDQLVQAMAGFGAGGTSDGLNALGTETTPPQLLTVSS